MARANPILSAMKAELPGIMYQRRKLFRPNIGDAIYAYKIINRYIFDNKLRRPIIEIAQTKKCWAYCEWHDQHMWNGSWCSIRLTDKWFCAQWFMNVLAHEMVHQYQWDIYRWEYINLYGTLPYSNSGGHGPTFFEWRDRFANFGLTLKTSFGQRRWFRHQNFNKC
jgi:hypothetical protein